MEKYILMIDDDLDDFLVFNDVLGSYPELRCHYASSAADGIEMMLKFRPELVLLDLNMPAVDGFECLKNIKETTEIAQIPIVIFSTGISEKASREVIDSGAAGCLKKPNNIAGYGAVVERLVSIMR